LFEPPTYRLARRFSTAIRGHGVAQFRNVKRDAKMMPATQLHIRADADRVPVVNSRDIAEVFGKQHKNVLRDIENLIGSNVSRSWFRPVTVLDNYGREQPSINLTRDGFMLLVMGWNGERAMALKVAYIEAFNAMESELRTRDVTTHSDLIESIREIVRPLSVRFDGQDVAIERIETRVDGIADEVSHIKFRLCHGRRRLSEATKREHVAATFALGGRCPCCGMAEVIDKDGNRSTFSEFDHFYHNSNPSVDATWLTCKPCNQDLATGKLARDQVETQFRSYQEKRRRLPGRQPQLF
jgi:Rha family phage regulatory protein